MDISHGEFTVTGVEIIDVAEALSAANVTRLGAPQYNEPGELNDFETLSLRVAAARGREQQKWNQAVYDTASLEEGLPLLERDTEELLAVGGLSKANRRALEAKLGRLSRMRKGLASLAAVSR